MFRIPTSVLLLVGLILATCIIAYWSDNLGKKLGKKRISLFGLRPRQTATLISMVTSVGIMLFTLLVLMVFSSQVRDAILRVDRLRDNNQKLRRENDGLLQASNTLKANVKSSQEQASKAEALAAKAVTAANEATKKANTLVSEAQGRIAETERRLKSARTQLSLAQAARKAAQQGQISAKNGERLARQHASEATQELAKVRQSLDSAKSQYSDVKFKLEKSQEQLRLVKNLNKSVVQLNGQQLRLLQDSRKKVSDLQNQASNLQTMIELASTQYEKIKADLLDVSQKATEIGTKNLIVDLGQVFADVVVPPKIEPAKLRVTLQRLLDAGSQAALKLGGHAFVNPETGIKRALHLATVPSPDGKGYINETALLEHFVNYLTTLNVPVSVRLVSARRYAEPENPNDYNEFQAKLEAVPVNRVYSQGDTVSVANIDGSQRDSVIFNQLLKLVNEGGASARAKGVTPLLSDQIPEFFATGTNEQIFDTLRALQVQGKPMLVRMVAAEDIYSVDPMNIKFVLESDSQ